MGWAAAGVYFQHPVILPPSVVQSATSQVRVVGLLDLRSLMQLHTGAEHFRNMINCGILKRVCTF
jgi:hypothetical protein